MRTATAVGAGFAALAVWFGGVYGDRILLGLRYEQEGPATECADAYPERKPTLQRAEWRWFPPEMRCIYEEDDGTTRSLPAR